MPAERRGLSLVPLTLLVGLVIGAGWIFYESVPRPVAEIAPKPEEGPVKVRLLSPESRDVTADAPADPSTGPASARPEPAPAAPAADAGRWEEEVAKHEAAAQPEAGGVVLVGASNIRMWDSMADDFAGLSVTNRGVGGCRLSELADFAPRLINPAQPAVIVVSAGSNDIHAGAEPEEVLAAFRHFLDTVRRDHPEVPVVFLAVLPAKSRWDEREKQVQANDLVQAAIASLPAGGAAVEYLDMGPSFLGADGLPDPEAFLDDDLHPSALGNARRAAALRPVLERLLGRGSPGA